MNELTRIEHALVEANNLHVAFCEAMISVEDAECLPDDTVQQIERSADRAFDALRKELLALQAHAQAPAATAPQTESQAVREAFNALCSTVVSFKEGIQEFFCKVCCYRDPLGPDGNKLHDDDCPVLHLHAAVEQLEKAAAVTRLTQEPKA